MHVSCHCPNISSRGLPNPQGTSLRLHAVSNRLLRLQAHPPALVPSSALRVLPIFIRPTIRPPGSLTSAMPSSTQARHFCLSAPSSTLSSILPRLSSTFSNLHAILATCTLLYPLATIHRYHPPSRATQCTHSITLLRLAGVSLPTRQRGVSEECY